MLTAQDLRNACQKSFADAMDTAADSVEAMVVMKMTPEQLVEVLRRAANEARSKITDSKLKAMKP